VCRFSNHEFYICFKFVKSPSGLHMIVTKSKPSTNIQTMQKNTIGKANWPKNLAGLL
jgi:hypothetical protein